MEDGLKESVTLAIKERLSSPLWGYILLSWAGFNWQNIAKLFMSQKTVEERITDIISQNWFYFQFLIAPMILGASLAIISPYLKQWLSAAHKRADRKQREELKQKIIDKYDDDIAIVGKKVAANKAQELAEEKEHTKVIQEQEKQKREVLNTESIEENLQQLEKKKYNLETSIKELGEQEDRVQEETKIWRNRSLQIINTIKKINSVSDSRSLNSIKDEISGFFSEEELEISVYAIDLQNKRGEIIHDAVSNALSLVERISESYKQELDYGVTSNIIRHKEIDLLIDELTSALKIIDKNVYMSKSNKNKTKPRL
ncbi:MULTISPECIES: hypothetical protein [Pectobacterium]|uniref:hypothetical protein n=1 Tax=Pectobacterium TaxID=122277 RepID=UPI0015DFF66E|nr:hypothetical protein [Pectobacterium brasiliense]MBA0214163.1 hypothetical protein [Pectobacterium brasiliense]MBN3199089.1 hypothetical protein [Pectobacterium brasiliense]MBN7766129.1 hypothetical protein [Pectobacterium brasiliense]